MTPGWIRGVVAAGCVLASLLVLAPAPTPSDLRAVAFPGDNGRVAFVSTRDGNDEIYVMLPDGGDQTRLTTSSADEGEPAWSPDGTRLLFTRRTPGATTSTGGPTDDSDLWVMSPDGSGAQPLTDTAAHERAPAWSPDGNRIAYLSDAGQAAGTYDLWVMGADGSDPRVLVDVPETSTARSPAWSPDGSQIAYAASDGSGARATRIWVAGADGSGPTEVAANAKGADEPDWSPDGSQIVYVGNGHLTVVGRDGSDPTQVVTDVTGPESDPSWAPDGQSIVYARLTADFDFQDVWSVAPDGSGNTQLTPTDNAFDTEPSWQPVPQAAALSITPDSSARELGDDVTVVVTATDPAGAPATANRIVLQITGPHPQTALRTTGADGRTSFTWEGTTTGSDTVLVCADADASAGCDPGEVATSATVLWTRRLVDRPRLAFTDDSDALFAVTVARTQSKAGEAYTRAGRPTSYATTLTRWDAGPTHEGEAGGVPATSPVFVSTRDDPRGEVYRAPTRDGVGEAVRITCDPDTETHPVLNESGAVAYASDADGDWDIYVSAPPPPVIGRGRSAPPARAAAACAADWTTVNVTDEPDGGPTYTDLWPSWLYEGTGFGGTTTTGLVFSRAGEGALPDLFQVLGTGPVYDPPTAITATPDVAETQPAAMAQSVALPPPTSCEPCFLSYVSRTWVAFATTDVRSSGTVAILSPADPTNLVRPAPARLQASEPAWSSTTDPTHLAVTSTEDDPYGDLAIAQVATPTLGAGDRPSDPVVTGLARVGGLSSGTAESHPHWLQDFDGTAPATLVYTGRADDVVAPAARRLHADISDVLAADGSQRRTIRRQRDLTDGTVVFRHDEAGPAYTPDGAQVVWSQDVDTGGGDPPARVLMVATADGDDPAPLLAAGDREPFDVDLDPVVSPDGSRVAFVRIRRDGQGVPGPPEIWVDDVSAATVTRIPGTAVGGDGADLSPSWAPDSTHLVIARSEGGGGVPLDAARRWSRPPVSGSARLVVLDVTRLGAPATRFDSCGDGCDVRGRSPAWSPDGTTIVYEDGAELRSITLPAVCCSDPVVDVDPPLAVTGFDDSGVDEVPTPSRPIIAAAQDPAWSPDGTEIAFSGQPVGRPDARGIWGVAPDGSGLRLITDEPGPESEPAWQDRREADLAVAVTVAPDTVTAGAPMVATFTVSNFGPLPATDVVLDTAFAPGALTAAPGPAPDCDAAGTGCAIAQLDPGESRVYEVSVRHLDPLLGSATGTVAAAGPTDPDLTNNIGTALYRVRPADVRPPDADVKVRIRRDDPVGYVGGERTAVVTVRNVGSDPVGDVNVTVVWAAEVTPSVPLPLPPPTAPPAPPCLPAGTACPLGTLLPGAKRSFRVGLQMLTEAAVTLGVEVSTTTPEVDTTNNTDDVALEIRQPAVRVLPAVAPPGRVVLAYGEKMPPGSEVDLAWTLGITIDPGPFLVQDDGTVRVPLLVVRHDLLGTRLLTATSTDDLFTPVDGDLLVVPRTLVPPNFNGRS